MRKPPSYLKKDLSAYYTDEVATRLSYLIEGYRVKWLSASTARDLFFCAVDKCYSVEKAMKALSEGLAHNADALRTTLENPDADLPREFDRWINKALKDSKERGPASHVQHLGEPKIPGQSTAMKNLLRKLLEEDLDEGSLGRRRGTDWER